MVKTKDWLVPFTDAEVENKSAHLTVFASNNSDCGWKVIHITCFLPGAAPNALQTKREHLYSQLINTPDPSSHCHWITIFNLLISSWYTFLPLILLFQQAKRCIRHDRRDLGNPATSTPMGKYTCDIHTETVDSIGCVVFDTILSSRNPQED